MSPMFSVQFAILLTSHYDKKIFAEKGAFTVSEDQQVLEDQVDEAASPSLAYKKGRVQRVLFIPQAV